MSEQLKSLNTLHIQKDLDKLEILQNKLVEDMAPVKHGKWIDKNNGFGGVICSNCKWKDKVLIGDYYYYCPNCGAKMDKKEDEK